jgi:hypothetical protein
MNQCHGQVQASTHPDTECTCPAIRLPIQSDQLHQFVRAGFGINTAGTEKSALQREKLQWLHERVDTNLLQRHTEEPSHGFRFGHHIRATDCGAPVRRQRQRSQNLDGCALACPIGTQKTKDASPLYMEGKTVNGLYGTGVVLGKVLNENSLI